MVDANEQKLAAGARCERAWNIAGEPDV